MTKTELPASGTSARARVLAMEGTEMSTTKYVVAVSPANASFGAYLRAKGLDISDEQVQYTSDFHREWQSSPERKAQIQAARDDREAVQRGKEIERANARAERDAADEKRLQAALAKIAERKALRTA